MRGGGECARLALRLHQPRAAQQRNLVDCGVFLVHYASELVKEGEKWGAGEGALKILGKCEGVERERDICLQRLLKVSRRKNCSKYFDVLYLKKVDSLALAGDKLARER